MFIHEKRRVKFAQGAYRWDRTFYVCESKRIDGKPHRMVLGWFKNALSMDEAIQIEEQSIKDFESRGCATLLGFGFSTAFLDARHKRQLFFLKGLREWRELLPDWRAPILPEPTYDQIPQRKPRSPRPRPLVRKACELVQQMDQEELQEFFYQLRDLETAP